MKLHIDAAGRIQLQKNFASKHIQEGSVVLTVRDSSYRALLLFSPKEWQDAIAQSRSAAPNIRRIFLGLAMNVRVGSRNRLTIHILLRKFIGNVRMLEWRQLEACVELLPCRQTGHLFSVDRTEI